MSSSFFREPSRPFRYGPSDPAGGSGPEIRVLDLPAGRLPEAIGVLARGMRDNPVHVAAYGPDPEARVRRHRRVVEALFRAVPAQRPLVVTRAGSIVAVAGVAPVGTCRPSPVRAALAVPGLIAIGPRSVIQMARVALAWGWRDPDYRHVHLGPVAVDLHLQGNGFGSLLLAEHCRRLDAAGEASYLETDKPENVTFYRRFGFEVTGEATILGGVRNWFMTRPAPA